jgi:guanidinoacetate N-methyltransferase
MSNERRGSETLHETMRKIGFPKTPSDWKYAPSEYSEDRLSILGHSVMEDWEDPYMQELAQIATSKGGVVLEVGFGLGISAGHIQSHPIDKHIVIEANAGVFSKLVEFSQKANSIVVPMFGLWREVIPFIADECVDGILFDPYPLSEDELHGNTYIPFFNDAYRILKKGGVFTYFSSQSTDLPPSQLEPLQAAGVSDIQQELCPVNPPEDCIYWNHETFVSPIIRKW